MKDEYLTEETGGSILSTGTEAWQSTSRKPCLTVCRADAPQESGGGVAQEAVQSRRSGRMRHRNAAGVRKERKEVLKQRGSSGACQQFGLRRAYGRKQGWAGWKRAARPGERGQSPELAGLYVVSLKAWVLSGRQWGAIEDFYGEE